VVGVEAECRIGKAVVAVHYEIGWHINGTTGVSAPLPPPPAARPR